MRKGLLDSIMRFAVAFALALVISSIVIVLSGENPLQAYGQLFRGALVGGANILRSLRWGTPYILAGLAMAISLRAGVFNIGLEGCVCLGGLAASLVGFYITGLPIVLHVLLALLAAMLVGGLWMLVPAILRAYYEVNEVITTLMFSYVAILFSQYLVTEHLQDPSEFGRNVLTVRTQWVQDSARLPQLFPPFQLNVAIIIAVFIAFVVYYFFKRTVSGYEFEMTGLSHSFAQYGGVDTPKVQSMALILSGVLGALAGGTEILGIHHAWIDGFSKNIGANGSLIALMGRLDPVGVPVAALFLGSIENGARTIARESNVTLDTITILVAVIVMCITAEGLYERISAFKVRRRKGA